MARRMLSLRIPPEARPELDKFLERLSKAIKAEHAMMRIEGDRVIIELYGSGSYIRESLASIKKLLKGYTVRTEGGLTLYPARKLHGDVGAAIPLDVVAAVLTAEGKRAEVRGEYLATNASYDEVLSAASRARRALEEASRLHAARATRRLLAALAASAGVSVEEALEEARAAGCIIEDSGGRLLVAGPWIEAFKKVLPRLRSREWRIEA